MVHAYEPKSLIDGFKLGATWGEYFLIAIPKKNLSQGTMVFFNGEQRLINGETAQIEERVFKDKFGPGNYTLCYFIWSRKNGEKI